MARIVELGAPAAQPASEQAPEGLVKGKDGYYTIQVKTPFGPRDVGGILTTMLRVTDIPGMEDGRLVNLEITPTHEHDPAVAIPENGFVVTLKVVSAAVKNGQIILALAPEQIECLVGMGVDYIAAARIEVPFDQEFFINAARPGARFFITADFLEQAAEAPVVESTEIEDGEVIDPIDPPVADTDEPVVPQEDIPPAVETEVEVPVT